jgi:hypothetical protein
MNAESYCDTVSTSMDSDNFRRRVEFVRNYKVLVDYPKHGVLSSINLGVKSISDSILCIYIKFQEIGKRKVL